MKSVGVGSKPLTRFGILLAGIWHAPAVGIVIFDGLVQRIAVRIWICVPTPLRLSSQRNAVFIKACECLQTSNVSRKGKFPVANSKRGERVRSCQSWDMTGYKCPTVDEAATVDVSMMVAEEERTAKSKRQEERKQYGEGRHVSIHFAYKLFAAVAFRHKTRDLADAVLFEMNEQALPSCVEVRSRFREKCLL